MTGAQQDKRPVVVLAEVGEPAADAAWAWLTGHRWEGYKDPLEPHSETR